MTSQLVITKYPPAKFVRLIEKVRHSILRIYKKMIPPNIAVLETVQGFWVAKAVGVAAELNIADILMEGPKTIAELAIKTQTHEDSLYRLLRLLTSHGIFKETQKRIFCLTPMARALAEGDNSMKYMVIHQTNAFSWNIWGELLYSVRTGHSGANKIVGMDIFDYIQNTPERSDLYNKAMTNASEIASSAIVSAYDFSGFNSVADIGGGHGLLLSVILFKHKHLKGIVFDLPNVVIGAKAIFEKYCIPDRTGIEPGNCFDGVPRGYDAYILKSFLHLWSDEKAELILKNIHNVMVDKGKILIIEPVLEENNAPSPGKIFDIQMLVSCEGGRERTRLEFEMLFSQAGFTLDKVIPTVGPFCIIEGSKKIT